MENILSVKNTALEGLSGIKGEFSTNHVPLKPDISTIAVGEMDPNSNSDWKDFLNPSEPGVKWIAAGVSLALIILFVIAVKYRFIKL